MLKAVYPGTFDPIHRGHEDLVRRAGRLVDHIVVGVADSKAKKPMFTATERIAMVREVLSDVPNLSVVSFSALLMDFVREVGAHVVVRGLRGVADFEYEFQMAGMNRRLYPDLETLFMAPGEQHTFVSATLIREIARFGGDVAQFVHPLVRERLADRVAAERRTPS